jgi:hypothetical protein
VVSRDGRQAETCSRYAFSGNSAGSRALSLIPAFPPRTSLSYRLRSRIGRRFSWLCPTLRTFA